MSSRKRSGLQKEAGGDRKIPVYYLIVPMTERQFFNAIPPILPSTNPAISIQLLNQILERFGNLMLYTEGTLSFIDFLQQNDTESALR